MIHAAKRFGISDVALRKTCMKHGIPTPPLGYWAKVAHGKRVVRPPLPALNGGRDHITLALRPKRELPAAAAAALAAAQLREAAGEQDRCSKAAPCCISRCRRRDRTGTAKGETG